MFKFMLTILGAVAKMERELTVERIREDMAKARRYNTRSGSPVGQLSQETPASFKKHYPMWRNGDITATDFASLIGQADRRCISTFRNMTQWGEYDRCLAA